MVTLDDKPRHAAGCLTYPGDCTHILGEVKVPLTYGGVVTAVEAVYDPTSDATWVTFAHSIEGDL